jgi:hypothetical protein
VNSLSTLSQDCQGRDRLLCFDYGLAGIYTMGVIPCFRDVSLFDPADAQAEELAKIISSWTSFYRTNSDFLNQDLIHIARPDSRHVEAWAAMDVADVNGRVGIVSVFNPTNAIAEDAKVSIPLYQADVSPGDLVTLTAIRVGAGSSDCGGQESVTHTVGEVGAASLYDIALTCQLAPSSYIVLAMDVQVVA